MLEAPRTPHLVPFDSSFKLSRAPTSPGDDRGGKKRLRRALEDAVEELGRLQQVLYAHNKVSVLLLFQAMDAAGKDSTIRRVLTGVDPAGCQVFSFGKPSAQELDHDFLWRCTRCLPERGRIGVFNRSWYEEVLIVRVHPEILEHQRLPWRPAGSELWRERLESIHDLERHLARNGTVILKFFLNVSLEEQRRRFLDRIERPEKNWKFNEADVEERRHWDAYMSAYEEALNATSRPWAPWYAIPADHKPTLRLAVARTVVEALRGLHLRYPPPDELETKRLQHLRELLRSR
ncbi:MAG TPA: polyphosphate kinase 2 family protein [Deltaproteobacteria bacterium]|nr:polyphosphate kinase 2 family protein [Deltaproteobacteria bacterium]